MGTDAEIINGDYLLAFKMDRIPAECSIRSPELNLLLWIKYTFHIEQSELTNQ